MWRWRKDQDTELVSAKCIHCGAVYYPIANEWDAVSMEEHEHQDLRQEK